MFFECKLTTFKANCGQYEDAAMKIASEVETDADNVKQRRKEALISLKKLNSVLENYMVSIGFEVSKALSETEGVVEI